LIDLHTHTTASDGTCSPDELVDRAAARGVHVLGVTDHDTTAGCADAARACVRAGIEFVSGIEITAVADETDVHVLGYFVDPAAAALETFLAAQRRLRIDRVRSMIDRLAQLGMPLDMDAVLNPSSAAGAPQARAIGRPWIARAMVRAGYVATTREAFDKWLARGRPGFVARSGAAPAEVVGHIHRAGAIASLAHPGLLERDDLIPPLVDAGLDALEAYHTDHTPADVGRYLKMAEAAGLAVSGGSDYHGDDAHGGAGPGSVSLPREAYDALAGRLATIRATASGSRTSS
jgi:3',5'-nucleoside bisphosphate phosphatase